MKAVIITAVILMTALVSITLAVQGQIKRIETRNVAQIQTWDQQVEGSKPPPHEWSSSYGTFELVDDTGRTVLMSIDRPSGDITIQGDVGDGKPLAIIHPTGSVELNANGDLNEAATRFWQAVALAMPECYKEGESWGSNETAQPDR